MRKNYPSENYDTENEMWTLDLPIVRHGTGYGITIPAKIFRALNLRKYDKATVSVKKRKEDGT